MLAERLKALLEELGCSNAEVARWANVSPSTVSRLKGGSRTPKQESATVGKLADGICSLADYGGRLDGLAEAVGAAGSTRSELRPAVIAWLFDADGSICAGAPASAGAVREAKAGEFGRRLGQAMDLAGASNAWLARRANVDASLVSRMRHGRRFPRGDEHMQRAVAQALVESASAKGRLDGLSRLAGAGGSDMTPDVLRTWLFDDRAADYALATRLVEGIGSWEPVFPAGAGSGAHALPAPAARGRYWGEKGMREAVTRLLADAAAEGGGELLLYSDEPMDWLTADAGFLRGAAVLLASCAQAGVKTRIAHNFDRGLGELVDAIGFWMPLYMTGSIEPYALHGAQGARFFNTALVRPGRAAVLGAGPQAAGSVAWHDYARDAGRVAAAEGGARLMLEGATPILKVYRDGWERHAAQLLGVEDGELEPVQAPSTEGVSVAAGRARVMAIRERDPKAAFLFEEPRLVEALRSYLAAVGSSHERIGG